MEKIGNITKNTSYLTFALILQKVISFTYFTLMARNLGAEDLGKYYFALSFTTVFAIFIDIGMVNVLTREIAKKQDEAGRLLGATLAVKVPLAFLTVVITAMAVLFGGYSGEILSLIWISLACVIIDSFTTTFWAVSRGMHNLIFESVSSVLFQVIVMSFGLFFLYQGYSLVYIMSALLIASLFNFCYSSAVLMKKFKIAILPIFDKPLIIKILTITVPFGLYAIFQRLYMYLDSVLLGIFSGNEQVGYYQISFKIIFALQFLPMAFVASLYPAMSDFWKNNQAQLKISFEKALVYLMIISLPITAGVLALSDKIILIFKEGYGGAVLPMQITIISVLFMFVNFPIGSLLNACDRQKRNTINMFIVVAMSIVLNLILIPKFQAVGASITVLVTNVTMTALGLWWAFRIVPFRIGEILKIFFKISISALVMGVIIYLAKEKAHILILIPLGAIIYFFLLFIFKALKKDEVAHIYHSFLKR